MNKDIKYVVESLEIPQLKKQLQEDRKRLFELKCEMSRLTFDRNVGLYAYYVDEMDYLITKLENNTPEKVKEIMSQIKQLEFQAMQLTSYPGVCEYSALRDEYYELLLKNDYYLAINMGLRERLPHFVEMPKIYIEQSHFDFDKHIIDGSPLKPIDENDAIVIDPTYYMESLRDYRHFYNKVSFKYLEQLCEDYSFDLEGKRLGKVRIRGLKKNY